MRPSLNTPCSPSLSTLTHHRHSHHRTLLSLDIKHISHRTHVLDLLLPRVARVSCTLRTSCPLRRVHVRAERVWMMIVGVRARDAPIGVSLAHAGSICSPCGQQVTGQMIFSMLATRIGHWTRVGVEGHVLHVAHVRKTSWDRCIHSPFFALRFFFQRLF